MTRVILILLAASLIAACGVRGDLKKPSQIKAEQQKKEASQK